MIVAPVVLLASIMSLLFPYFPASEEAYLKQLAIEELYGKKQAEKAKLEKEQRWAC